tara:strand:+ start:45 stop:563 length:519 start_codon:yes stop_codon:yes gene_type:complete
MTKQIEVFDNFLEEPFFKDLESRFCGQYVQWTFNSDVVYPWDEDTLDNFQFTCTPYKDGTPLNEHYNTILPFFNKLDVKIPLRVKINLQTVTPKIIKRSFHSDMASVLGNNPLHYKTAIFYVNTNNGYTEFETGEIVESVANRVVIFDGSLKHRGTTCTDQKTRVVLNINYI